MLTDVNERDRAMLHLLRTNLRDDQIAAALLVSERTMQRQLKRLMHQANVVSRFGLGEHAARAGWFENISRESVGG